MSHPRPPSKDSVWGHHPQAEDELVDLYVSGKCGFHDDRGTSEELNKVMLARHHQVTTFDRSQIHNKKTAHGFLQKLAAKGISISALPPAVSPPQS